MRTGAPLAATLLLAGLLTSCGHDVDPALVADLEELDIPLFLPDLRGAELSDLHVDGTRAVADLDVSPGASYEQLLAAVSYGGPGAGLCGSTAFLHEDGSTCRDNGEDAVIADFEEMSTVVVLRDGVFLVARGLVTEADPDLALDAVVALREAPQVSAEELAEAVPGLEDQ